MARVLVYKRPVDSVAANDRFYEKLETRNAEGVSVKIKEEPPDVYQDNGHIENTTAPNSIIDGVQIKSVPTLFTESHLNNKENISSRNNENAKNDKRINKKLGKKRKQTKRPFNQIEKSNRRLRKNCHSNSVDEQNKLGRESTSSTHDGISQGQTILLPPQDDQNLNAQEIIDGERFECDICFLVFDSASRVKSHKQDYTMPKKYKCKLCPAQFARRERFNSHKRSNHQLAEHMKDRYLHFQCNFCSMRFRIKHSLQGHLFHYHYNDIYFQSNIQVEPEPSTLLDSTVSQPGTPKEASEPKVEPESPTKSCLMSSTPKKFRQTTMTEFFQVFNKKPQIQLETCDAASSNHSSTTTETHKKIGTPITRPNSLSNEKVEILVTQGNIKKEIDDTPVPNKPFVQLYANPDIIMALLDKSVDKSMENTVSESAESTGTQKKFYNLRHTKDACRFSNNSANDSSILTTQKVNQSNEGSPNIESILRKTVETSFLDGESSPRNNQRKSRSKKHNKSVSFILPTDQTPKQTESKMQYKNCTVDLIRCDKNLTHFTASRNNSGMDFTSKEANNASTEIHKSSNQLVKKPGVSLKKLPSVGNVEIKKDPDSPCSRGKIKKCYTCKVCNKVFFSKRSKREHVKLVHTAYMSTICKARFTLKYKLLNHYMNQHVLFRRKDCCICGESFKSSAFLKQHLLVHCIKYTRSENDIFPINVDIQCSSFKKSFKCIACGKSFYLRSCLKEHQNVCRLWKSQKHDNTDKKIEKSQSVNVPDKLGNSDTPTTTRIFPIGHASQPINETISSKCMEPTMQEICPADYVTSDVRQIPLTTSTTTLQQPLVNQFDTTVNQRYEILNTMPESVFAQAPSPTMMNLHNSLEQPKGEDTEIDIVKEDPIPLLEGQTEVVIPPQISPCKICGRQFRAEKHMLNHKRIFAIPTEFCKICGTGFSSKRFLRTHVNAAHVPEISQTFKLHCRYCNQGFSKKNELRTHELHLHPSSDPIDTSQPFSMFNQHWNVETMCDMCHVTFRNYELYAEHNMYYNTSYSFTCAFCGQVFQGMYMLHHHHKTMHYPEKTRNSYNYKCDICNEGFKHNAHFHSHKVHVHANNCEMVSPRQIQETSYIPVLDIFNKDA